MKQQRSGVIVNVGSIAGKMTLPWFTLYSASKYAIGSLTDGLRMELRIVRHPHADSLSWIRQHSLPRERVLGQPPELASPARRWAISPEKCAEDIIHGIEKGKRTVVTPASGWLLIALERLFPALVDRQLERVYLQRVRQG